MVSALAPTLVALVVEEARGRSVARLLRVRCADPGADVGADAEVAPRVVARLEGIVEAKLTNFVQPLIIRTLGQKGQIQVPL